MNRSTKTKVETTAKLSYKSISRELLLSAPIGLSWKRNQDTNERNLANPECMAAMSRNHNHDNNQRNNKRSDSFCSSITDVSSNGSTNKFASRLIDDDDDDEDYGLDQCPQVNYYKEEDTSPPSRPLFDKACDQNKKQTIDGSRNIYSNHANSKCDCTSHRAHSPSSRLNSDRDAFLFTVMDDCGDCYSTNSTLKGDEYKLIEHIILPKDTLEGLCLKYKTSATRLRQINQFSSSSLLLAPKRLLIPLKNDMNGIKLQDTDTTEYKIHKVLSECCRLGMKEIEA